MSNKELVESCMKLSCVTAMDAEELGSTILHYLKDDDVNNLIDVRLFTKKEDDRITYLIRGTYVPVSFIYTIFKAEGLVHFNGHTISLKTFESQVEGYKEVLIKEDNETFLVVDDINDYVLDLVLNDGDVVRARKSAPVRARQGKLGEIVETEIDKTVNTVKADEEGNLDWIVTNPGGEEYVVSNKVFTSTYDEVSEGLYVKNKQQLLVYCSETVVFTPTWGGNFTVEKGGYFTINGKDDIAGIQPEAFKETYEVVSHSNEDKLEVILTLAGNC